MQLIVPDTANNEIVLEEGIVGVQQEAEPN